MKTNKLLRYFFTSCILFATTALSAQTLVTKWEAEDFVLNGFAGGGGSEPSIVSNTAFSKGKAVSGISNSNLIMQNIYVVTEGTYELKIYYSYTADQAGVQGGFITTRLNSQTKQLVATKLTAQGTNAGDVIQVYSVLVYCEAGWNTVKIGQNGNGLYNPYIDKCELYTSGSTITKPADDAAALLATLYPASFTTKNVMYGWDLTNLATSATILEGRSTTLANLTDNDLSTTFVSTDDSVKIQFDFQDSIVVKHVVMNNLLKLGKFKLEYLESGVWKVLNMKSAYHIFAAADGALWIDTQAGDLDNYLNFKLTLYKAPGAPQIEVADVLLVGYYYTKDIVNGGSTYRYMADDITNDINGAFISSSTPADMYNTLTGFQTLDNSRGSKFSVPAPTFNLVYQFNTSARVNSYVLANSSSAGRDPKTYEIQGSNDNTNWTSLARVDNLFWKGRAYMYGGTITSPGYFKYYRFDMQVNNGDAGYSELGDLLLFGDVTSVPTDNVPTGMSFTNVYGTDNQIVIKCISAMSYTILDVTGRIIKQGNVTSSELSVPMAKGVYLVKTSGANALSSVAKVIVK